MTKQSGGFQWIANDDDSPYGVRRASDGAVYQLPRINSSGSLVDGAGNTLPPPQFVQPRIIKQFSDLLGVTFATSNATINSQTIDQNSPFGCPALKLNITWGTTGGRVEVMPPQPSIPNWNGNVGYTYWIDDATKVGAMSVFAGTTSYALYQEYKQTTFAGGDLAAGHRAIVAGAMLAGQSNLASDTFTFGSDTLSAHKLRIQASNPIVGTCTIWIKDCFIPAPQRPVVVFSFDDGYDAWHTNLRSQLAVYGFKATFGIASDYLGTVGTRISSAKVQDLIADGHQVASHNQYNYRLRTLAGNLNGEQNGTGTATDVTTYVTDYNAGIAALEALGANSQDMMYHPWVQGGVDFAGIDALYNAGVELARTTAPYGVQPYGYPLGLNAMQFRATQLGNSRTLQQAKDEVDKAIAHGGLTFFMGHNLAATASDATTWAIDDMAALLAYVASKGSAIDVLTARQLRDRLNAFGLLSTRKQRVVGASQPVRCIGTKLAANMNSTADQSITLMAGVWKIEGIYVTNPSVSLTTAAGGFYPTTAKGGTAIVASSQAYSGLTAATSVIGCTMADTPDITNNTIYLSLTTAQGVAATADVFVFGRPI